MTGSAISETNTVLHVTTGSHSMPSCTTESVVHLSMSRICILGYLQEGPFPPTALVTHMFIIRQQLPKDESQVLTFL